MTDTERTAPALESATPTRACDERDPIATRVWHALLNTVERAVPRLTPLVSAVEDHQLLFSKTASSRSHLAFQVGVDIGYRMATLDQEEGRPIDPKPSKHFVKQARR